MVGREKEVERSKLNEVEGERGKAEDMIKHGKTKVKGSDEPEKSTCSGGSSVADAEKVRIRRVQKMTGLQRELVNGSM